MIRGHDGLIGLEFVEAYPRLAVVPCEHHLGCNYPDTALSDENAIRARIVPNRVRRGSPLRKTACAQDRLSLQLDHPDGANGVRREAAETPRIARQHSIPRPAAPATTAASTMSEALACPKSSPAALARLCSKGLHEACLHHLGQASLAEVAPRLESQGHGRDDRDNPPLR